MNVEIVTDYITQWLQKYALGAGMKGYVVGISGGIDSAVTSTLCARTGLDVLCVEMPIHQHADHVNRAHEHIDQLKQRFSNVRDIRTDLSSVFDEFVSQVPEGTPEATELTLANTRARLRMTTLYYHGGINRLLVAGTGNKVEDFGVGFYTKYGDGGVDVSPIADLLKSQVYALGNHLKVPQSIMTAAPSDGLYGAERTDEQQLGATYDELEKAMKQQQQNVRIDDLDGRDREVYELYLRLNKLNSHKMKPIPVCEIPDNFMV